MNKLPTKVEQGTIGELLVQLRLLQFGIQAAPPLKDSGNDLIAIKDDIIKCIQVKSTIKDRIKLNKERKFDLLAIVFLKYNNGKYSLDESKIYLLGKGEIQQKSYSIHKLESENCLGYKTNKCVQKYW